MATQPDPSPDTIEPVSPPETPPVITPQEDPAGQPDEIVPPTPDFDQPDNFATHLTEREELYDLAADPGETRDLAGAQSAVVEKLAKAIPQRFVGLDARNLRPFEQVH